MWVDKRPKSLKNKIPKRIKKKKKPYKVTHQCEISDRHEKRKILKSKHRGKNRLLSTGKKSFERLQILKVNKEAKSQWNDSYGVLKKKKQLER